MPGIPWARWESLSKRNRRRRHRQEACQHATYNFENSLTINDANFHSCDCLEKDEENFRNDFLYERKFADSPVLPINVDGAIVIRADGVIEGPYMPEEWATYNLKIWDLAFAIMTKEIDPMVDWSLVYVRSSKDFKNEPNLTHPKLRKRFAQCLGSHYQAGNYSRHINNFMMGIRFLEGHVHKHESYKAIWQGVDVYHNQKPINEEKAVSFRSDKLFNITVPHYQNCAHLGIDPDTLDLDSAREWDRLYQQKFHDELVKPHKKSNKVMDGLLENFDTNWQLFKPFKHIIRRIPSAQNDYQTVPFYSTNPEWVSKYLKFTVDTIDEWLMTGALTLRPKGDEPIMTAGCIYASMDKKARLCYDGSITKALEYYKMPCKLDCLQQVAPSIPQYSLLSKNDDKRGFHQMKLNDESRTWSSFEFAGRSFSYEVPAFGERTSPAYFNQANMVVINILRKHGYLATLYLDDRLFIHENPDNKEEVEPVCCFLGTLLITATGGFISVSKSDFTPKSKVEFLGINIDSTKLEMSVPASKWAKFCILLNKALAKKFITYKDLEIIRGTLCSFILCYDKLKLYIRRQTEALLLSDLRYPHVPQKHRKIQINDRLREELLHWQYIQLSEMTKCWAAQERCYLQILSIWSDASQTAAGAVIFLNNVKMAEMTKYFAEHFHQDTIAFKEALAILYVLREFPALLRNRHLVSFCDNQNVYFGFRNEGSKIPRLNDVIRMIYEELVKLNATIQVYWVGTSIQLGDRPSRHVNKNEEFLPQAHFKVICNHIGTFPQVDVMATEENKKCKLFVPWRPSRSKWAVTNDFLGAPPAKLLGKILYIFPPKNVLQLTLARLRDHYWQERFILVVHVFQEDPLGIQMFRNSGKSKIFHLEDNRSWTLFPSEREFRAVNDLIRGSPNKGPKRTLVIAHNLNCFNKPERILLKNSSNQTQQKFSSKRKRKSEKNSLQDRISIPYLRLFFGT